MSLRQDLETLTSKAATRECRWNRLVDRYRINYEGICDNSITVTDCKVLPPLPQWHDTLKTDGARSPSYCSSKFIAEVRDFRTSRI